MWVCANSGELVSKVNGIVRHSGDVRELEWTNGTRLV